MKNLNSYVFKLKKTSSEPLVDTVHVQADYPLHEHFVRYGAAIGRLYDLSYRNLTQFTLVKNGQNKGYYSTGPSLLVVFEF